MSKKEDEVSQLPPGFDSSAGLIQHNLEIAAQALNPILAANSTILRWNADNCRMLAQAYSQWFEFIGHRLEEDASLADKFHTLKDPKDLSKACSSFLETAAKDYRDEASELTKLSKSMANAATDALQDASVSPESGAVMGE